MKDAELMKKRRMLRSRLVDETRKFLKWYFMAKVDLDKQRAKFPAPEKLEFDAAKPDFERKMLDWKTKFELAAGELGIIQDELDQLPIPMSIPPSEKLPIHLTYTMEAETLFQEHQAAFDEIRKEVEEKERIRMELHDTAERLWKALCDWGNDLEEKMKEASSRCAGEEPEPVEVALKELKEHSEVSKSDSEEKVKQCDQALLEAKNGKADPVSYKEEEPATFVKKLVELGEHLIEEGEKALVNANMCAEERAKLEKKRAELCAEWMAEYKSFESWIFKTIGEIDDRSKMEAMSSTQDYEENSPDLLEKWKSLETQGRKRLDEDLKALWKEVDDVQATERCQRTLEDATKKLEELVSLIRTLEGELKERKATFVFSDEVTVFIEWCAKVIEKDDTEKLEKAATAEDFLEAMNERRACQNEVKQKLAKDYEKLSGDWNAFDETHQGYCFRKLSDLNHSKESVERFLKQAHQTSVTLAGQCYTRVASPNLLWMKEKLNKVLKNVRFTIEDDEHPERIENETTDTVKEGNKRLRDTKAMCSTIQNDVTEAVMRPEFSELEEVYEEMEKSADHKMAEFKKYMEGAERRAASRNFQNKAKIFLAWIEETTEAVAKVPTFDNLKELEDYQNELQAEDKQLLGKCSGMKINLDLWWENVRNSKLLGTPDEPTLKIQDVADAERKLAPLIRKRQASLKSAKVKMELEAAKIAQEKQRQELEERMNRMRRK